MSVVPKTAGLVSHDGMNTPLSPGDIICCLVWVGGLLKANLTLLKWLYPHGPRACLNAEWAYFILQGRHVHVSFLALTPIKSGDWTSFCLTSRPWRHKPDTVPQDLVLNLSSNECGAKNCRVSIPRWDANPPYLWGHSLSPTSTSRGCPQGEQLEVPCPPAGVDPDGCLYQAGIRTVRPVRPKRPRPVGPHHYLYLSAFPNCRTLVPCTITVQSNSPDPKHGVVNPTNNKHKHPDVL